MERVKYLEQLKLWREKQVIKVITGVRSCGKSTLFQLYINYLKSTGVKEEQILFINLEDIRNEHLLSYKSLYDYIMGEMYENGYTYVFIDEVRQCRHFEKVVDSLFIQPNVDIYISGFYAHMLSGELATLLSGRYIEIRMLPLSFREYAAFTDGSDMRENFRNYLRYGAFPYAAILGQDDTVVRMYLEGIYNTILVKDISKREGIGNIDVLESVVKFLCSNIGSPISVKKISDNINASGRKISTNTVDQYLRSLVDSYIFYKVDRYDLKGRNILKTLGKYYIVDTGFRNLLLSGESLDLGHQLENIVYFELLRRGCKVNIGKLGEREVDFVAREAEEIVYYQVSASVMDESTLARELAPLKKIKDNYPKYLLTLDDFLPKVNHEGIWQINVLDWLMNKPETSVKKMTEV